MSESKRITGGCMCGALRYEAEGEPRFAGYCCCADCRKASGSGFIPFMGFAASAVRFTGETRQSRAKAARGGVIGKDSAHSIYAGSLDDPSLFHPTMAIFNRDRPEWVILPPGLKVFETMPG